MKTGVSKNPGGFLRAIMSLVISFAALAASPEASVPKPQQTTEPTDLSGVEDLDQQAGPFAIGEQNYTVFLHVKHLAAATEPPLAQTLAGLEIRDTAGNIVFERKFPLAVAAGRFEQSVSASEERFSGKTGTGLAVHYTRRAVGQSQIEEFWQLFGLVNGNFAVLGKPATIGEPSAGGPFMGEKSGQPTKTVVKEDSKVEVLTALVATHWLEGPPNSAYPWVFHLDDAGSFGVTPGGVGDTHASNDLWLKVRIDGKEGWMHSEEDFYALGLPEDE